MTDDLTAELDRIAERAEYAKEYVQGDPMPLSLDDVPRLLAALRAVLELTEPSGETHYDLDGNPEQGMIWVVRCDKVREAITREITGAHPSAQQREESGDG